jgi:tetratricopeptide (TPR) repeat protein
MKMTRIKIGSMKVPGPLPALMLVLALALTALPPGSSRAGDLDSANESVLEVWRLFDEGDLDGALVLAGEIHGAEGDSLLVLTALLGFIHEEQGRYDEALSRLDSVRPTLRERLLRKEADGGEDEIPGDLRSSYLRLYVGVLRASGFAHFRMGNCSDAVTELQELMATVRAPNPLALSMIGVCMYRRPDYDSARQYFEEAFKWYGEGPLKDEAAYNVAAMHALLGSAGKSVEWLRTASMKDRQRWVEAASSDSDFDGIRQSEIFVEFVAEKAAPP